MKKIRVGIIGCGSISEKRHAPEYIANPDVEIAAFYDVNRNRAEMLAGIFGGKVADSYMEILEDPDIDAISDCTPNDMHYEVSVRAMELGKHVLCEKPMAKTLEQAEDMVKVQKVTGKIFMLDHNQRFTEAHKVAREIIKSGRYGKVLTFRTTFGHGGPENWSESKSKNTWFFKKDRCYVGAIGDLGVHKLDLIRFLTEDEYEEVTAMGGVLDKKQEDGSPIEVPDNAVCILKMRSGVIGTAAFSWTFYGQEDNSTIIYLQKGIMRIYDDPEYQIKIINEDGSEEDFQLESMQTNDAQTKTGVMDSFIECILENKQPVVDAADGLQSMKIVDAVMKSIETKSVVKL